jgi:hypothetical protein
MMCSDYYDYFTVNGSGTWSLELPVDNTLACNSSTLDRLKLYWITDIADCDAPNNAACWDLMLNNVSANGQNLAASNLSVLDLGGTPFVAGDNSGFEPTAISLQAIRITPKTGPEWLLLALGLTLFGLSLGTVRYKRWFNG